MFQVLMNCKPALGIARIILVIRGGREQQLQIPFHSTLNHILSTYLHLLPFLEIRYLSLSFLYIFGCLSGLADLTDLTAEH